MPYTKDRTLIEPECLPALTSGELNYQISRLMNAYMNRHGISYDRLKDCTSACEEAAEEFRRRFMVPYEDTKILENGDVYDGILVATPFPPLKKSRVPRSPASAVTVPGQSAFLGVIRRIRTWTGGTREFVRHVRVQGS